MNVKGTTNQTKKMIINNFYDRAYRDGTTKFMRLYHISRCINWHGHIFLIPIKRFVCKWVALSNARLGLWKKIQTKAKHKHWYLWVIHRWWKFYKPINMDIFSREIHLCGMQIINLSKISRFSMDFDISHIQSRAQFRLLRMNK